jgi:hypothetical protein
MIDANRQPSTNNHVTCVAILRRFITVITKDRIYMFLHIVTWSMQLYESKKFGRFIQF